MGVSMIDVQRDAILSALRSIRTGEWKLLVVDEGSWKIVQNVVSEDDILHENITNVEHIETRRTINRDMNAIYLLSPEPHIFDCLMADLERRRYRKSFLLFTSRPHSTLRTRLDKFPPAKDQVLLFRVLDIGFFPRESHVVTFRDPWSFPVLFHPSCGKLVRQHLEDLAQKIVSVCVSLGEYPTIRYHRPQMPIHEASVLCSHLAKLVQDEIDMYAQFHQDFPPPSNRPRASLYILDRSMDLYAPLLHEFTYQAMVHDLLPVREGSKISYKVIVNEGRPNQEDKELEISEKDKIWVANRHRHMKDTIEKLMGEFQRFLDANPHFKNTDGSGTTSLNAIKDMMAGLPQFQEMKEAYSLHLTMAQDCMNAFERQKLPDQASIEQSLATGLDEDYKKPKNLADQIVRTLDEDSIGKPDRLRLILQYLLYSDGLVPADTAKLIAHAQLPPQDREVADNLHLLGARVSRQLNESRPPPRPLFAQKQQRPESHQDYALSRFSPALKQLLQEHVKGTLDQELFPYTKPQLDVTDSTLNLSQTSLRSAKPTWAKARGAFNESRQRVIVFMAGGATYSEARACYEVSDSSSKDVYLLTSHLLTPKLFIRQVGDLSVDKRALKIPAEQPKPKAPAHLFEAEPQPQTQPPPVRAQQAVPQQPTKAMADMNLAAATNPNRPSNGVTNIPAGQSAKGPSNTEKKKKASLFSLKK